VRDRIERPVLGPYLELFARAARAITLTNAQRHSISEINAEGQPPSRDLWRQPNHEFGSGHSA
jgi:hypothetical protein